MTYSKSKEELTALCYEIRWELYKYRHGDAVDKSLWSDFVDEDGNFKETIKIRRRRVVLPESLINKLKAYHAYLNPPLDQRVIHLR